MVIAGSLALAGLAGCGGGAKAPTTTKELVERYEATANKDNYHMDMDYKIDLDLLGSTMTVDMKGAFDCAGKATHGTMTMNALGQNIEYEMYAEAQDSKYVQYMGTKIGNETTWMSSALDTPFMTESLTKADLLADAEFATTDSGYTLTVPGEKLASALTSMGGGEMLSSLGTDASEMFAGSKAIYTFDKDCVLNGLDFTMDYKYDAGGDASMTVGLKMALNAKISDYGKIDAASVAVPADVKSNAIDTDAISNSLESLGAELGGAAETSSPADDAATSSVADTAATSSVADTAATSSAAETSSAADAAETTSAAA